MCLSLLLPVALSSKWVININRQRIHCSGREATSIMQLGGERPHASRGVTGTECVCNAGAQ